jgi:hypothetical protein
VRRLQDEWAACTTHVIELEARRAEAVAEDERAFAEALRADKPDPGRKLEEAVQAELEQQRRRAGALAVARDDAQRDLVAAVHEHASTLRGRLDQEVAAGQERYAKAVEAVAAARSHIDSVQTVARWLTTFLDPGRSVTKVAPGFLRLPGGRDLAREEVLAALADDASPKTRTRA